MLKWLIDKLFLVKTIREKDGTLHFLRYRLFACPWFRLYLHKICLPDYDAHKHSHPWSFLSIILWGAYLEAYTTQRSNYKIDMCEMRTIGHLIYHGRSDFHQIEKLWGPVWTLVFTLGKHGDWGYLVGDNIIDHAQYRHLKNEGLLPD